MLSKFFWWNYKVLASILKNIILSDKSNSLLHLNISKCFSLIKEKSWIFSKITHSPNSIVNNNGSNISTILVKSILKYLFRSKAQELFILSLLSIWMIHILFYSWYFCLFFYYSVESSEIFIIYYCFTIHIILRSNLNNRTFT